MNTITLSNGVRMPIVGLATSKSKPGEVKKAVKVALEAGYRHFDALADYENEDEIGSALAEYISSGKLKREDVFITAKAWCSDVRNGLEDQLRDQLKMLGTSYVDLYLAFTPPTLTKKRRHGIDEARVWQALEDVYEKGLVKAIGVTNWTVSQMERAMKNRKVDIHSCHVELHLHNAQFELQDFCKKHNIALTARAPLGLLQGLGPDVPMALENQLVRKLAEKHKKTPAQILLRHLIQRGICVFDFELSQDEVDDLNRAPQHERLYSRQLHTKAEHDRSQKEAVKLIDDASKIDRKEPQRAAEMLKKAAKLLEDVGELRDAGYAFMGAAHIQDRLGQPVEAGELYATAGDCLSVLDDEVQAADLCYGCAATIYVKNRLFDKAARMHAALATIFKTIDTKRQEEHMRLREECEKEHRAAIDTMPAKNGGADAKKEHVGANEKKEHADANEKKEHAGAKEKKEHAGANGKKEHVGANERKEHVGANEKKEHVGAKEKKEHTDSSKKKKQKKKRNKAPSALPTKGLKASTKEAQSDRSAQFRSLAATCLPGFLLNDVGADDVTVVSMRLRAYKDGERDMREYSVEYMASTLSSGTAAKIAQMRAIPCAPASIFSAMDRVAALLSFNAAPEKVIELEICPALYAIHTIEQRKENPKRLPLTYKRIDRDGIYLLDCGTRAYLYVCEHALPSVLEQLFGATSFMALDKNPNVEQRDNALSNRLHQFLRHLQRRRGAYAPLIVIREDGVMREQFMGRLMEDEDDPTHSCTEFLQHLRAEIQR